LQDQLHLLQLILFEGVSYQLPFITYTSPFFIYTWTNTVRLNRKTLNISSKNCQREKKRRVYFLPFAPSAALWWVFDILSREILP
jgi:hypothetical protein